jgi:diaminohydroxyphosphoribosylaminopyrimidine deaminase/5-amino-6-(5-phosphoribosylamino)uracil reductase
MKTRNPKSEIRNDEQFISRAIELAKKGAGYVSPNPLVGCVIVKNGKVAAEGYHKQFGSDHAEVNAINSAIAKKISLKGSVLYVNLEPCSHTGKTPPCTEKIIQNKISKVIIGTKDPNPLVSGKGTKKLQKHRIKVTVGVLEEECNELNRFYLKHIRSGLPYITLKAAQTLDGKIADSDGNSKWISSVESRKLVHLMRSKYDAVLVGKKTVETDNPSLTVRLVKGRNPYRIVINKDLVLNLNNNLFSDDFTDRTIVITAAEPNEFLSNLLAQRKIKIVRAKLTVGIIDLKDAMKKIAKLGINSVLVEGGSFTFSEFLRQKMVDEIMLFTAPKIMGSGISTFKQDIQLDLSKAKTITSETLGSDVLTRIR